MRISDWSSDVCSSDLIHTPDFQGTEFGRKTEQAAPTQGRAQFGHSEEYLALVRLQTHLLDFKIGIPALPRHSYRPKADVYAQHRGRLPGDRRAPDRKSTRLNSSH